GAWHRRPDPVLPKVRRERLGRGEGLPGRADRPRRQAGDRQVHRRAGRRRRGGVHHHYDVHDRAIDAPGPRAQRTGPSLTSTYVALTTGTGGCPAMKVAFTGAARYIGSHVLTELQAHGHEATVKTARSFGLPVVHSTINVASGREGPTVPGVEEGT